LQINYYPTVGTNSGEWQRQRSEAWHVTINHAGLVGPVTLFSTPFGLHPLTLLCEPGSWYHTSYHTKADDITVYRIAKSLPDAIVLQILISTINGWCDVGQVAMNTNKCLVIHLFNTNSLHFYHISEFILSNIVVTFQAVLLSPLSPHLCFMPPSFTKGRYFKLMIPLVQSSQQLDKTLCHLYISTTHFNILLEY